MQEKLLSARAVATLAKPGRHADGGGLYLSASARDGVPRRSWVYLFTWRGKLKEMGLGPYPLVSLAEAREQRDRWRKELKAGRNPIEARRAKKAAHGAPSFGECAAAFLEAKAPQWKNAKHRCQWRTTLETYAGPLWSLPVDKIDTTAVLEVLQPVWQAKPETASRVRGRIESVLDAARARGFRTGENPARWRGHLDHLLPKRHSLTHGRHAALPYASIPDFIAALCKRQDGSVAARALEFLILTGARSGEVLGARWGEIDLEGRVWTVPAARMKAKRPHRVPLSDRAIEIIERLAELRGGEFVFLGQREGMPLSSMALEMVMRRMKAEGATVHGFRSAFRDWAGNETHFARELAEAALAHVIGDRAEQAYRRGDALEKRRALMEAWASFVEPRHAAVGNIVALGSRGAA
jgi:integrase